MRSVVHQQCTTSTWTGDDCDSLVEEQSSEGGAFVAGLLAGGLLVGGVALAIHADQEMTHRRELADLEARLQEAERLRSR